MTRLLQLNPIMSIESWLMTFASYVLWSCLYPCVYVILTYLLSTWRINHRLSNIFIAVLKSASMSLMILNFSTYDPTLFAYSKMTVCSGWGWCHSGIGVASYLSKRGLSCCVHMMLQSMCILEGDEAVYSLIFWIVVCIFQGWLWVMCLQYVGLMG